MEKELVSIAHKISPSLNVFGQVYRPFPLLCSSGFTRQIPARVVEVLKFVGFKHEEGRVIKQIEAANAGAWRFSEIEQPISSTALVM